MAGKVGELQGIVLDQGRFILNILNEQGFVLTEEQSKIGKSLIARMTVSFMPYVVQAWNQ